MDFDRAFELLIGHEGGYVNHPDDPGGETKYGISKRQYPGEDIKNLTLEHAKQIYYGDYWGPAGCDVVPDALKFDVFDVAVNMGVKTAIRLLQKSVGEVADGVIGSRTLSAISCHDPKRVMARFNGHRLEYMAGLNTWNTFGRGWARRIAANLKRA